MRYVQILSRIKWLHNLKFTLTCNHQITDKSLRALGLAFRSLLQLKELSLNLSGNSKLTDAGLIYLENSLTNLKKLELLIITLKGNTNFRDQSLMNFRKIFELLDLNHLDFSMNDKNVTITGLTHFVKSLEYMKHLSQLNLNFLRWNGYLKNVLKIR